MKATYSGIQTGAVLGGPTTPRVSMGQCDRSHFQDSKRGGESFWDGLGVEFEAKQVFDRENSIFDVKKLF